jgi:hypothetical protein
LFEAKDTKDEVDRVAVDVVLVDKLPGSPIEVEI